jgi:hypothetical protein
MSVGDRQVASGIVSTIGLIRCRSANVIVSSMSWAAPPAWPRRAPALMMSCSGQTCSESAITAGVMSSPWVASPSTAALIASALAAVAGTTRAPPNFCNSSATEVAVESM